MGFTPIYIVSLKMVGLGKGAEQSIHVRDNKEDKSRGDIFGKMVNTGGIIQEANSDGHCFILRDILPMNLFR